MDGTPKITYALPEAFNVPTNNPETIKEDFKTLEGLYQDHYYDRPTTKRRRLNAAGDYEATFTDEVCTKLLALPLPDDLPDETARIEEEHDYAFNDYWYDHLVDNLEGLEAKWDNMLSDDSQDLYTDSAEDATDSYEWEDDELDLDYDPLVDEPIWGWQAPPLNNRDEDDEDIYWNVDSDEDIVMEDHNHHVD